VDGLAGLRDRGQWVRRTRPRLRWACPGVVWASSEATLDFPFDVPPRYAPVDEDHYPVPTSTYALSRVATETIAEQFAQWSGIPFLALRFSKIMSPENYHEFASFWGDPQLRKWNLWSYVDERDVALSCRLPLRRVNRR
jgi:nucleoside-diphosphate-sugar epimerase